MRTARHVRVDGHWKDELVIFSVKVVEMILWQPLAGNFQGECAKTKKERKRERRRETNLPDIFNISRVDPSMAVRGLLDEHHGRQVIDVPVPRNLHQARILAPDQRLHPSLRLLRIVDLSPRVSHAQPIHLTVMVRHGMVVFDSIGEQHVRHLLARLPPRRDDPTRRFAAEVGQHVVGLV